MPLGTDELTRGKALYILGNFLLFAFLTFVTANSPENRDVALFYALLGIGSLSFIFFDFFSKKAELEYIDSVTYEPSDTRPLFFGKIPFLLIIMLGVVLAFYVAGSVVTTQASFIGSPSFQALPFGGTLEFQAILAAIAGLAENAFFFALFFPTIYSSTERFLGLPELANLGIALVLISLTFTGYHYLVYGLANVPATVAVFVFASINAGLVYVFRNMFLTDVFHGVNNLLTRYTELGGRIGLAIFGGG